MDLKPGMPTKDGRRVKAALLLLTLTAIWLPPASVAGAKALRTTICHATGSETNPYVRITVDDDALPAHHAHQDHEDIIPAPTEGCPRAASSIEAPPAETTEGTDVVEDAHAVETQVVEAQAVEEAPVVEVEDFTVEAYSPTESTPVETSSTPDPVEEETTSEAPSPTEDTPISTPTEPEAAPSTTEPISQPATTPTEQRAEPGSAPVSVQPIGSNDGPTAQTATTDDDDNGATTSTNSNDTPEKAQAISTKASSSTTETTSQPNPATTDQLPFTGFKASLLTAIGLALLLTGLILRRTTEAPKLS